MSRTTHGAGTAIVGKFNGHEAQAGGSTLRPAGPISQVSRLGRFGRNSRAWLRPSETTEPITPTSIPTPRFRRMRSTAAGSGLDCAAQAAINYYHPEAFDASPRPVTFSEGVVILVEKPLRRLMDIELFVDTDSGVRILRRLRRDLTGSRSQLRIGRLAVRAVGAADALEFVDPRSATPT